MAGTGGGKKVKKLLYVRWGEQRGGASWKWYQNRIWGRSLIEKIIGERKSNFSGVRNATTKRWGTKGTLQSDYARTKCLLVCFWEERG